MFRHITSPTRSTKRSWAFVMQCFKLEKGEVGEAGYKMWRAWYAAKVKAYYRPSTVVGKQFNYDLEWLGEYDRYGKPQKSGTMLKPADFFQPGDDTPADQVPFGSWSIESQQRAVDAFTDA